MHTIGSLLAWVLAPLAGAVPATGPARATLRLVWINPTVGRVEPRVAMDEAARILDGLGAALTWRESGASGEFTGDEIAVILLPAVPPFEVGGRPVMGSATYTSCRAVWAYLDGLSVTLDLPRRPPGLSRANAARMGIALGRVVAHEVIHVVTASPRHDGKGLMKLVLGRAELSARRIEIAPETEREFRRRLFPLFTQEDR